MPDSADHENQKTPRFPKALIGRFVAVGLFLAAGTFAVLQTIGGAAASSNAQTGDLTALNTPFDEASHQENPPPETSPANASALEALKNDTPINPRNAITPTNKPGRPSFSPLKTNKSQSANNFVPPSSAPKNLAFKPPQPKTKPTPQPNPQPKVRSEPLPETAKKQPLVKETKSPTITVAQKVAKPPTAAATQASPSTASVLPSSSFKSPPTKPAVATDTRSAKPNLAQKSTPKPKPRPTLDNLLAKQTRPGAIPPQRRAQEPSAFTPRPAKPTVQTPINNSASSPSSGQSITAKSAAATTQSFNDLRRSASDRANDLLKSIQKTTGDTVTAASDSVKKLTPASLIKSPDTTANRDTPAPSAISSRPRSPSPQPKSLPSAAAPNRTLAARSAPTQPKPPSPKTSQFLANQVADSQPAAKQQQPPSNFSRNDRGRISPTGFSRQPTVSQPISQRSTSQPSVSQLQTRPNRPPSPEGRLRGTRIGQSGSAGSVTKTGTASGNRVTAQLASSVRTRSMNLPGDRRLEGVQAPSLVIEKVSPREIQIGQTADFEVKVRNVGRVATMDVTVVDRVPEGTEFLGADPEPSKLDRSGNIQWTFGAIEPGQEKRIRMQLRPTRPGEIGSVAQVLFATEASMRTLVTKPVLAITHSSQPKVMIGDNVVFDVVVENRGDGAANNVVIQEEVPDQLEYQEGFRQIEYEIGTLNPGQKRKVKLALKASKVGQFRNIMLVSGKGGLQSKHEIDVEVVAPEITVSSKGPSRRYLQRQATHKFSVENRGTATATNVQLVARLPAGLRYVDSDNRGRYDSQSHAVYWRMPQLNNGIAGTVELVTVPVNVGDQNIKFEAAADLNLTAKTEQKLLVEHLVDIFFDIDDVVDPIEVGSDTSYRIRVINQGTKTATNVTLQVEFPRGLEPTSVDSDLRNQINNQRVLFEPISSLPPGKEVSLIVRAAGRVPGDHRVVASIRAQGRDVAVSKEDTTRVYSDQ